MLSSLAHGGLSRAEPLIRVGAFVKTPWSRGDVGSLVALVATALLSGWAATHATGGADLFRDLYFAQRIAQLEEFPTEGPVIGGLLKLGPIWFYLLALPYALGGSAGALAFIGALSGAKYALAYLLSRLHGVSVSASLLWPAALALPTWSSLELIAPTHTSIVVSSLLALAIAVCGWKGRSPAGAVLIGLLAGLCLHAHPTTLVLVSCALAVAMRRSMREGRALRGVILMACGVLLLVFPVLLQLAAPEHDGGLERLAHWAGTDTAVEPFQRFPDFFAGVLWLGPVSIVTELWLAPEVEPWRVRALGGCVLSFAGIGMLRLIADPGRRARVLGLLFLLALQTLFVLLLRPISPYWMVLAHTPLLAVLIASGFAAFASTRFARRLVAAALLGLAGVSQALLFGFLVDPPAEMTFPAYAEGSPGIMDIAQAPIGRIHVSHLRVSVPRIERAAAEACGASVLHGHLAHLTDISFGLGFRRHCEQFALPRLGGAHVEGERALAGLNRSAAAALNCADESTKAGVSLHEVRRNAAVGLPFAVGEAGAFPWRDAGELKAAQWYAAIDLLPGEAALVTNRLSGLRAMQVLEASCGAQAAIRLHDDRVLSLIRCPQNSATSTLRLRLMAVSEAVDVVSVSACARGG